MKLEDQVVSLELAEKLAEGHLDLFRFRVPW
jgi:hypothetical protein